jgi:hypothetical protein
VIAAEGFLEGGCRLIVLGKEFVAARASSCARWCLVEAADLHQFRSSPRKRGTQSNTAMN